MKESLYDYCIANGKEILLEQWDTAKNEGLSPKDVSYGSGRKVWWACNKGHEWQARVCNRSSGQGCPVCNWMRKGKAVPGENNLTSVFPDLAAQWHPTKNGDLRPQDVPPHSNRKVWWACEKGHEWQSVVKERAKGGGCPYCINHAIIPGENDFATAFPELAAQWHPTKNGDLRPQEVAPYSRHKAWWVCEKGHEWYATIQGRAKGAGCPVCTGRKVVPGENDFASAFPFAAAEWHPTKNGDLRPQNVTRYSNRKVWWKCAEGHEWEAFVFSRARGNGCPYCAKKKV